MNQIRIHTGCYPYVRDVGKTLTHEGWVHPDRITEFNVFIFVVKGQMQVVEEGKEYLLTEGTGFFLKSGLHHWGCPGTIPGTSTLWIHFFERMPETKEAGTGLALSAASAARNYKMFTPADYEYEVLLPKRVLLPAQGSVFQAKVKELYELYSSPVLFNHITLSLKAMDILMDVYRYSLEHPPERERLTSKSDAVVRKLAAYLEEHWEVELEPDQCSAEFQLNYRYMSTLFKNRMGVSMFHYHERLRIHKAAELLKSTSMNITEVGLKLGYANAYYFSRVFKKVMGESPSDYIRNVYRT